jgi:RNA polymerase sigma-70 factor
MGIDATELQRRHGSAIADLYRRAGAARWAVTAAEFAAALRRAVDARFPDAEPSARDVDAVLAALNVADLALARGCELGAAAAWNELMTVHRPVLYAAARALGADEPSAREVVDVLWADLWGVDPMSSASRPTEGGRRRTLLRYFHGRSSLATWLRAVLARRIVDARRAERRSAPLDEEIAAADPPPGAGDPERLRYVRLFEAAIRAAIAALDPDDRLRLSYYYLRGLTLAEIGRLTAEHESTVSRKLDRSRKRLRKDVERRLRRDGKLADDQIRLCYEYGVEEGSIDVGIVPAAENPSKNAGARRSELEGAS